MEKRLKIAVFTSNIYEPMVQTMLNGITKAAEELGIKLICFTSFSDSYSSKTYQKFQRYNEGDIVAIELPDLDDFDGVIKVDQSSSGYTHDHLMRRLSGITKPVINVGSKVDGLINILNDETRSLSDIVEHVISHHGCRDIYHLAGIEDKYFTKERVDAYKNVLIEHGIDYDPSKVYYGTLWKDCGEAALDYFLDDCKKKGKVYPDAIICANDYSAIGLIAACSKRGIRVPEDIIVTGYDGVDEAYQNVPSLTTSEQPFYDSGYNSVYVIKRMCEGENITDNIRIKGKIMCKQSCGCEAISSTAFEDIRSAFQAQIDGASYLAQSMTNLTLGISDASSLEECFREISNNASIDTGFEDMLLCLPDNWDQKRVITEGFCKENEEMTVVAGFVNGAPVTPSKFMKRDLLPEALLNDDKPYYIFSIHHLQYYMGYLIVSPKDKSYNKLTMQAWIVNLGCMLDNWITRQELGDALKRMENLYNRDTLTDLYNRHGYNMFFEEYCGECMRSSLPLAVLIIDMDDLKYVNDNFGHADGDYSLCAIAEGMRVASKDGEICLRTGGDEFMVIAKDYTEEMARDFISRMRDHIDKRIMRDKKPYEVKVSTGYCIKIPKNDPSLITEVSEEYQKIADSMMYEEKKTHKARRNR